MHGRNGYVQCSKGNNSKSRETRDELHKASVTERFVALRNATVRYQKALRSAL